MKKWNKTLLIALFAMMTAFSIAACGTGSSGTSSSTGEFSSDVSSGGSGNEDSSSLPDDGSGNEDSTGGSTGDSSNEDSSSGSGNGDSSEIPDDSSGEDEPEIFDVTINSVEGLTVEGNDTATEGDSYSFTVSVDTGYQKTAEFAVTATVGGEAATVTEADGEYTVENVTGEIVITVMGVEKKSFNVTKTETTGVTFEGADAVIYGESYTFTVNFASGYAAGESFAVSVNGKPVTANESGAYVVENVKSGLVIVVEGVVEIQYKVTFTSEYADALKNQEEGFKHEAENYTFKIELTEKYTQSADSIEVFYKTEGGAEEITLTPDGEGVYTIVNPKANVEIIVKNVALNEYKVSFLRNAVVKYETVGTAGVALTQEQLDTALAALVGENEEFVAWREDVTIEIMDDVRFSVVTKAKEAWGELIEGNPLKDGAAQDGEYSAAGYEKVYAKANFETAPFAAIDLSAYESVKFAFKHAKSWILFDGWTYYMDFRNTWIDVTMEKTASGEWNVTMEAPVNHNSSEGATVVNPYKVTLTGGTLSEVFASWTNESNEADLYVTELRGVKSEFVKIADSAMSGATASTEAAPAGFTTVSERTVAAADKGSVFADVKISSYDEVRFAFKSSSWMLFGDWAKYVHKPSTWVYVQAVNNYDNTWTVTVGNYTLTYTGSTLKELLKDWYNDAGATFYVTELIGVSGESSQPAKFGEIVDDCLLTEQYVTLDETATVPDGFESVYAVKGVTNKDKMSTADLSEYSEIRFAVKSTKYFLIKGWGVYFKESFTDWANVVMKNNGDGTWTVTVYGDVFTGSAVENPYTVTYTGNSIATILAAWETDELATTYVTEIRGVK